MTEKSEYHIYEVFVQRTHLDHHAHVGSLLAPTADVAVQLARENFLRREQAVNLWIVPREQITAASDHDAWFGREFARSYREVGGYTENGRLWRLFKEKIISRSERGRGDADQKRRPSP